MTRIIIIILLTICQYTNSKEMNAKKDIMKFFIRMNKSEA